MEQESKSILTTPQEYADSLTDPGREWLYEFLRYMAQFHPDIPPVMFRQRPMFKVGKGYIMFTAAKEHFSLHTLNFDLLEEAKKRLSRADSGKGCLKIRFSDREAIPVLKTLCDEIVRLNRLTDAPPVDITPERPYKEKLTGAFSGGKAVWLPLYEKLRDAAKETLPEFTEYFPAVNVLWKHSSTFAQISAVKSALRLEFYSDRLHADRNPVKSLQTSKNRVAHTVELTRTENFEEILNWLAESYFLTKGR